MADVELRSLVKTYPGGSTRATDDVSLSIADGEFMVLLGPSGCGKTTLLRAVAGLELPDEGQVVIGGRDVTYLEPRHRNLSMVFQSYAVFPHKRVRDNIGFGLKVRGVPAGEIRRKVEWAAEMLELTDYLDRYPAKLSGGQRQRVAVARAIVVESDVLLMDEPLSNLDALLRLSFRADLKKLVGELGLTTIYVTHDQVEALSLGDRVAVMKDGRLIQIDEPERLHDHPADSFVASFIGEATMLPVRRVDASSVALGNALLRSARAIPDGDALMLAVHSEKLLIDDGAQDAACNRLTGTVTDIVYQGESLRIFLALSDGTVLSLRQPSHHAAYRNIPPQGSPLTVTLHPADTIVVPKVVA